MTLASQLENPNVDPMETWQVILLVSSSLKLWSPMLNLTPGNVPIAKNVTFVDRRATRSNSCFVTSATMEPTATVSTHPSSNLRMMHGFVPTVRGEICRVIETSAIGRGLKEFEPRRLLLSTRPSLSPRHSVPVNLVNRMGLERMELNTGARQVLQ